MYKYAHGHITSYNWLYFNFYIRFCLSVSHLDHVVHTHVIQLTHSIWIYLQIGIKHVHYIIFLTHWIIGWHIYHPIKWLLTSSSTRFCGKFMKLFTRNSEIAMKICKIWLLPAWLRKKKTHFEEKKALKNTFPQQKNTTMKKKHKKTLLFFKNTCWEDWANVVSPMKWLLSIKSDICFHRN